MSDRSSKSEDEAVPRPAAGRRTVVCTICSANYLAQARTLLESVARVHPDWDRHLLVVDEIGDRFDPAEEDFDVTEVADLPVPGSRSLYFRYNILELNTAVKPPFLRWLFEEKGYDRVLYIDPDIELYRPLAEVEAAFDDGAWMCLTPHLTGPLNDTCKPSEIDILRAGSYNLGFIALAECPDLHSFLEWWWSRTAEHCVVDFAGGYFVDQKWVDLAPGMYDGVRILRHEGYNVAYWNLAHRKVVREGDRFTVNGAPLVFFHYSGLNPKDPRPFSKHQDRFTLKQLGDVRHLVQGYCERVLGNGYDECRDWPYVLNRFQDGTPIADEARTLYRRSAVVRADGGEDPFDLGAGYFNEPWGPDPEAEPLISRLLHEVWTLRPDLQQHFPDPGGASRFNLAYWFVERIASEQNLPSCYVEPVRKSIVEMGRSPESRVWLLGRAGRLVELGRPLFKYFSPAFKARVKAFLAPPLAGGASSAQPAAAASSRPITPRPLRPFVQLLPVWLRVRMKLLLLGPAALPARIEAAPREGARSWHGLGVDFSGFHSMDEYDRSVGSAWMGRSCELLLPEAAGRVLRVDGENRGDLQERSTGEAKVVLRVAVDGEPAGELVVDGHGEFSHTLELESDSAWGSKLTLEADRTIVPRDLDGGEDHRELSVRVKRISLDGEPLLDFGAEGSPYRVQPSARALGFNVVGYLRSELGVGESGRLCAAAADAAGIPFELVDFNRGCSSRTGDDRWEGAISGRNSHPVNVIHVNADQMPVLYDDLGAGFFEDRYNVGVWHWELPEFPDEWLGSFALVQEIWAPTRFVADSVSEKSPVPVVHMPHAICFDEPRQRSRERFGLPERDFLFLTMYDMHSFQARKNPEAVIEAFSSAFADAKGVGLVIKLMNAKTYPRDYAALKERLAELPGACLIDETLRREDVYALESVCDAFVSLHRSEGFGLGLAESMYLGKPVIGTNWSGNVDFMTARNSCPVDYELVELDRDHGPYRKGQQWADPDLDQAAAYMRRLVDDSAWRARIAAEGRRSIRRDHSPEAIGLRYQRRLRVISRLL